MVPGAFPNYSIIANLHFVPQGQLEVARRFIGGFGYL